MDKIEFMEWALGISTPDIFPYGNYAMIMLLINLAWIVVRKKYRINYLPSFFVVILLGVASNLTLNQLGLLADPNQDPNETNTDPRLIKINKELSDFLGIKFVYIFLSPFLVMGEAFGAGHISYMFTGLEVVRYLGPKLGMAALNATSIWWALQWIFGENATYLPSYSTSWEIVVFLSFNVLSEGAAPLERNPSKKIQMEHIK
jgi:hypothetical protein